MLPVRAHDGGLRGCAMGARELEGRGCPLSPRVNTRLPQAARTPPGLSSGRRAMRPAGCSSGAPPRQLCCVCVGVGVSVRGGGGGGPSTERGSAGRARRGQRCRLGRPGPAAATGRPKGSPGRRLGLLGHPDRSRSPGRPRPAPGRVDRAHENGAPRSCHGHSECQGHGRPRRDSATCCGRQGKSQPTKHVHAGLVSAGDDTSPSGAR